MLVMVLVVVDKLKKWLLAAVFILVAVAHARAIMQRNL